MKLIHIYIHTYKHLKNLNIPMHGGFECSCTDNKLTLCKSKTLDDYYDGLSIQGIIGKNGVGKSTILELICNNKQDYSQQYLLVWHDDNTGYRVCCNYYDLEKISADADADMLIGIENHLTSIVNINNISPPFTYTQAMSPRISFLTPSTYKSYHANRRRQYKVLSNYFSSSTNYSDEVRPRYYISLKKLTEDDIRRVLKVIMRDKSAYGLFNKLAHATGISHPEKVFSIIDDYGSNLGRLNIYLTSCMQLTRKYQCIDELNSSFQHCAGLMLFIILTRNKHDNFKYSIDVWLDTVYPEFEKITWSYNDRINKKETLLELNSIAAHFTNDYIYKIESYFNGGYYKLYSNDETETKVYIDNPEKIQDFLSKSKNDIFDFSSIISHGWDGLSSGELAKSMLLANIYYYVNQCNHESSHLILIDEIDLYLHPEWQRKIINEIISLITKEISPYKIQLILTSHSPIIISDLLPENVVNIDRASNGEITVIPPPGYATQISDLYLSGMHISSTFGERVHATLTQIMNKQGILSDDDNLIVSRIRSKSIRQLLGSE